MVVWTMTYQFSFCVSGAILISFFSFSGSLSAPHALIPYPAYAMGKQERSNSPRSVMLKTSACNELPLRFLGSSFLGVSSTRESTLERVFSVAAAIAVVVRQQRAGAIGV